MNEPKIFLIGDCHFGHRNIIKYCNRPFKDVADMTEKLIKNWNCIVGKNDIVYVVGDFALCGKQKIIEIGQGLNGRKRLIIGNHEGASLNTYKQIFEYVYNHPIYFLEYNILLSHYPLEGIAIKNIHAHTHNTRENDNFHFCVSVEKIEYKPILLSKILEKW